jgi:hypothetical protein
MKTVYEQCKLRIAEAVKQLTLPPLPLLKAAFTQRQLQEEDKLNQLENELQQLKDSAYQAALRLYLSQRPALYMTSGSFVDEIRRVEGAKDEQ